MIPDQPVIAALQRRQVMKGTVARAANAGAFADIAHDLRLLLQH
jgi:hypothetical protein